MVRRWLSGMVAVGVLIGAGLTTAAAEPLSPVPAQDVAVGAVAAPTTGTEGSRTLAASENVLPQAGGSVTLTGTGFDPKIDVYLAVCAADIKPSDELTYCIGGGIPDDNDTKAWAVVTGDTSGKTNAVAFTPDGSFSATLTLDTPTGSSVDCVTSACAIIARSTGDQSSRPADMLIPITFETSGPTTTDNGGEVGPDAVSLPQANIGDQQTIVFSGFTPDEAVTVTLFSDPVNLPGVNATASGVVTVSFRVTDTIVPGQHVLQAVGSQSNRFGIAYFEVLAPPVTTPSTPTTTSSAPTTTSTPTTTTSATPTSTTTETATATTSSATVVVVIPANSGRNLWWLWIALIAVLLVGAVTGVVIMSRRRKEQLAAEERQREQELQEAAAEPSWRPAGTEPDVDPLTYDDGGLLSGRSGPGPDLYGGREPYPPVPPTTRIPPPSSVDLPTQAIPPVPPSGAEPPTTAIRGPQAPTPPAGSPTPDGPVDDTDFWLRELGTDPDQDEPPRR
jgi:hypothetical protein